MVSPWEVPRRWLGIFSGTFEERLYPCGAERMGRFVTIRLFSIGSGIGAVLFLMLFMPGNRLELPRVAADAEASSRSAAGVSITTAGTTLSNPLTLQAELAQVGVPLGAPLYLRIFKSNGSDGA